MNRSWIIFCGDRERANWRRGFLDEHRVYRAGNDLRRSLAAFDLSKDTRNLRCIGPREPERARGDVGSPTLRFAHPPSNGRAKIPAALLRSEEGGNEGDPGVSPVTILTGPFSCRIPSIARHCHAIRAGKRKTNYFGLAVLSIIPAEYTSSPCFHVFTLVKDNSFLWAISFKSYACKNTFYFARIMGW